MLTRRQLLQRGAAGAGGAMLPLPGLLRAGPASAAPSVATGLAKFRDPLPLLTDNAIDARGGGTVRLTAKAFSQQLHSQLPSTPLFGYARSADGAAAYPGPALLVSQDVPVRVAYTNALPEDPPAWLNPGATLAGEGGYDEFAAVKAGGRGKVRMLTHLHGGLVLGRDDGNPAAGPIYQRNDDGDIVTDADGNPIAIGDYRDGFGPGETQWADYPFGQPGSLLWFHDHYLGDTRMNVVAGLAAGCIVTDELDTFDGDNPLGLPAGAYDIPLVVQDKRFTDGGDILYPAAPASTNGPWLGEYFGDCMLVNGRIWPALTVEPAMYRLRLLNGSNARILDLDISGAPMYVIGSEGGFLPEGTEPVPINHVVMAPAERYDVIVDFRRLAGQTVHMKNHTPRRPVATPAPPLTQVMRITVREAASAGAPLTLPKASPGALGTNELPLEDLRERGAPLAGAVKTRAIVLNEVGAGGPTWHLNLNAKRYDDPTTEILDRDAVEDWVYVNTTADTHPMHTHLFTFQVMGRVPFDADAYAAAYGTPDGAAPPPGADPTSALRRFITGPLRPPAPEEMGWKDTVKVNPGQMTVIRAKFSLPAGALMPQHYVFHCHIVEHEDNDMMRPFTIS
jgi:FtsP/CotA-like multicopper oxidase with cupredoxin domain